MTSEFGKGNKISTEITLREPRIVALEMLETGFALAVRQRELLDKYIKERLVSGRHFYKFSDDPSQKPSLTKEGAELICLPHSYKPNYQVLSGSLQPPPDDSPYQITVLCQLLDSKSQFAGQGIGSACSMVTKTDGTRVQRQRDPGLRHNSTIKMACKSAYIAATLNSTAASEFFTQDMEDALSNGDDKKTIKEHWCEKHHTHWFKSGKMKAYAHPIKNEDGSPTLDDIGKALWCSEPVKVKPPLVKEPQSEPLQSKSEGIESESSSKPLPELKEEQSLINMDWLKETITTLQEAAPKMWAENAILSYMKTAYKVEGNTILEAAREIKDKGQAKHFVDKIESALKMI